MRVLGMTGKEETSPRGRGGIGDQALSREARGNPRGSSEEESPNGWKHEELKTALTKWGAGKTGFQM